jgi:hypothetical protein
MKRLLPTIAINLLLILVYYFLLQLLIIYFNYRS